MSNKSDQTNSIFGKVLLVEDDASHRLLISRSLKNWVGETEQVGSLAEGEKQLQEKNFSLIVTDLNLPDTPGLDTVKRIKALSGDTPILVLTSSSRLQDGIVAMREGASDFLVKNFDACFSDLLGVTLSRIACSVELRSDHKRLGTEIEALQRAIQNSGDALAVTSATGEIRYSNGSYARLCAHFSGEPTNIMGLCTLNIQNVDRIKCGLQNALQVLDVGGVCSFELQHSGEKDVSYELTLSCVAPRTASAACFVAWIRDIRERKLRERREREILSTTTHDLKGPLGAISLSCDVLLDSDRPEDNVKKLVTRIASSADSAIQIIDEFLSARRIQDGSFVLKPVATDVGEIAKKVVDQFSLMASSRGVTLELENPGPLMSTVDPVGLERVLANLVSNGVKFTKKDGVVKVRVSDLGNELWISIEDSGCGMSATEVQELFRPFARLGKHVHTAGTGLGLFSAKSIVDAHGGSINVSSTVGKGTSFDIMLPKEPVVNARGEVICLGA